MCRNKTPVELSNLLRDAQRKSQDACNEQIPTDDYWRIRSREMEIEWVCNVVSAAMRANGSLPIIEPTARGMMQASRILAGGVLVISQEESF